jgi:hypothetical protein
MGEMEFVYLPPAGRLALTIRLPLPALGLPAPREGPPPVPRLNPPPSALFIPGIVGVVNGCVVPPKPPPLAGAGVPPNGCED